MFDLDTMVSMLPENSAVYGLAEEVTRESTSTTTYVEIYFAQLSSNKRALSLRSPLVEKWGLRAS